MAKSNVVKPTPRERKKVGAALRRKYPQMFTASGELKKKYGGTSVEDNKKAIKRNLRERAIEKRSGLTEKELSRFR